MPNSQSLGHVADWYVSPHQHRTHKQFAIHEESFGRNAHVRETRGTMSERLSIPRTVAHGDGHARRPGGNFGHQRELVIIEIRDSFQRVRWSGPLGLSRPEIFRAVRISKVVRIVPHDTSVADRTR